MKKMHSFKSVLVRTSLMIGLSAGLTVALSACKIGDMTLTDRAPSATGPASSVTFNGIDSITQVAGTSVQLNWALASGASYYFIFNVTSGSPVLITTVSSSTAHYTVSGLTPSTTYKFRVRLTDSSGAYDANTNDVSVTTPSVTTTFSGWSNVKSVGPKSPAIVSADLGTASASTTLAWNAVTPSSGTISSYNIYRSDTPNTQTYTAPIATGISASTRSYTDHSVTAGHAYYYSIAPVMGGVVSIPAAAADREIKVITPIENMVLVHRWMANQEMCQNMGLTPDRDHDYRCDTTAPGGNGSYLDYGSSLLVDQVQQGCNYTPGDGGTGSTSCGDATHGCIGIVAPTMSAPINTVYYDRQNATCYINSSGSTSWTTANTASGAQLAYMASNKPGLPPLVNLNQTQSKGACAQQSVTGYSGIQSGNKRLLRHKEFLAAATWDASMTDADITNLENRVTANGCNTNSASGLAYDNNSFPANIEGLPACSNGDCSSTAASTRSVRTGSNFTSACVSRYGAQDLVGNVWEWNSDQVDCDGTNCLGTPASSNTADSMNSDFDGVVFNNTSGPIVAPPTTSSWTFATTGKILFPLGLPVVSSYTPVSGDGVATFSSAQTHGNSFYLQVVASPRGALAGGAWYTGSSAGRLALFLDYAPADTGTAVGFRCSLPAD